MLGTIVIYDDVGRIKELVSTYHPKLIDRHRAAGTKFSIVEPVGIDMHRDWWDGSKVARRPQMAVEQSKAMIQADGQDAVAFTGLPQPCTVRIDDVPNDVDDGALELAVVTPGVYRVVVQCWPYQDFRSEFTAV